MSIRTTRRHLLAASAIPAALAIVPGLAQEAATPLVEGTPITSGTPTAVPLAPGWPLYGHDVSGSRATTTAGISSTNVASLVPLWQIETAGAVSATPVISGGVAYTGSYDGNLYAVELQTGTSVWTYATGATVMEPNLGIPLGIPGSAAVDAGVVYVGDSTATVHAIDAASGEALWTAKIDEQISACIWSSPVVWNGTLFIGVASIAKEAGFRGSVVALNAATGELLWQTYTMPEGADGAGVFAVPAIDPTRETLYVGTQNAYSESTGTDGHAISVLALSATSGELIWAFDAVAAAESGAAIDDIGFSASPNLFSIEVDGAIRDLVGNGQKGGSYWALDRETGDVVWQTVVAPAGFLGGMEGSSAVHDNIVVVPATNWPDFEGPAAGLVSAFDADTGLRRWTVDQEGTPAASPLAISEDVVLQAGMDGFLHAYVLKNGVHLWSYDLGASVSGGIAVAEGVVVLGAATPEFAPFVRPGNTIQAFGLVASAPVATPVAATPEG